MSARPSPVYPANSPPARRPPRGFVLYTSDAPAETRTPAPEIDWTDWYLTEEDDMPQTVKQGLLCTRARSRFDSLFKMRPDLATLTVLSDNFFAWIESEPNVRVSPDVYVLSGGLPEELPTMWETWKTGQHPPVFALEVVSQNKKKEYEVNPDKYASLGVQELVIYDPDNDRGTYKKLAVAPLQRFLRQADGAFVCTDSGVDRVYCRTLDAWLIAGRLNGRADLLISLDEEGSQLVPMESEQVVAEKAAAEHERTEKERERAEKEHERAEKERERAGRTAAESEIAVLRERLRALGIEP